jgi:hypothetical protein
MTNKTETLREYEFMLDLSKLNLPEGVIIREPANKAKLVLEKRINLSDYHIAIKGSIISPQGVLSTGDIQKADRKSVV